MDNVLLIIEQAIQTKNWNLIGQAYQLLCGIPIEIPKDKPNKLDKLLKLLAENENDDDQPEETPAPKMDKKPTVVKKKVSKKAKAAEVKDDDAGGESFSEKQVKPNKGIKGYGQNPITIISSTIDEKEKEKNESKASKRTKEVREVSEFDIPCSKCGNTFKSLIAGGEVGQQCNTCVINTKNSGGSDEE